MTATVATRRLVLPVLLLAFSVVPVLAAGVDDAAPKVIAATEARNHIGENITAEMTVRSSKNAVPRREYYLDSEEDFRDEKNLAVVISHDHADLFKQAGIDDPADHYKAKKIRVTGTVIRENDQVRIRIEDPKRIKLVEADGK